MIRGAASVDNLVGFDTADVDWSEITQVAVPSPAPTAQATSAVFGTETSTSLNLTSFTAPAGGADGYAIYINDSNSFTAPNDGDEPTADLSWSDSGQQPVYFGTSASPNITVTDLDLVTEYFFQIYAYNDCSGTETYETTGLAASDTSAKGVLTISGLTGNNKVYDSTTAATATGTATIVGVATGDDVFLGGSTVYTFASANVGTGITITTTGYTISGADASKYTLTQPTLSGDITAKELTISGLTGDNKVYDGTTDATASGTPVLSGVVSDDEVVLGGTPVFTFASAELGTDISITTSGFIITGTDSGNYTLTQPTLSADIVTTLGIDDITDVKSSLKLHPNPAVDYIRILGLSEKANYIIYNLLGKEILRGKVLNEENIFIHDLSNGTYFIKVENAKPIKFIKK
jgi:hypothetical protein